MIKVYGCSDDLVEIEGTAYVNDEIGCYKSDVRIWFYDETQIRVSYGKPGYGGVWGITVENRGTAEQHLTECYDADAEIYSDVFEIDAEVAAHEVIDCER